MRNFPLLVSVPKKKTRKNPDPVQTLHISREKGEGLSVRTECGREIGYTVTRKFPVENFEAVGEDLMVEPEYEFEGKFRLCSRCGKPEDFARAMKEYYEGHEAAKKKADEYNDAKRKAVRGMQATARAFVYNILPEGATDVENDGWGLKFVHGGVPYRMAPTDEECNRLHKVAEEQVEWPSE